MKRIAFIVDWEKLAFNAMNFSLEGPNGPISASSPDVSLQLDLNYAIYVVKGQTANGNVGSDKWTLKLSGGQGLSAGETVQYNYSVISKSKATITRENLYQRFYAREDHLFEVKIAGIQKNDLEQIILKYDVPGESFGRWLASDRSFNRNWLAIPRPDPRLGIKEGANKQDPTGKQPNVVKSRGQYKIAPTTILGEPATIAQRKAYSLTHFSKRSFQNKRSVGEAKLFDDGTHGDKFANDGIYSAYLPMLRHDGLSRFGVTLQFDSDSDCSPARELWFDKYVRVYVDPDRMVRLTHLKDIDILPFYPDSLIAKLNKPVPEGYVRESIVFTPCDRYGNFLGPGYAQQINFSVKNAKKISPVLDNASGSYIQIIEYERETKPSMKISMRGVTSPEISLRRRCFIQKVKAFFGGY